MATLQDTPPALRTRSKAPIVQQPPSTPHPTTPSAMQTAKQEPAPGTSATTSEAATSAPAQPAAPILTTAPILNDSSLTPSPFTGTGQENAQDWLNYFTRFAQFKQLDDRGSLALFALLMRGTANTWFLSLPDDVRQNYAGVIVRFKEKYALAPISMWRRVSEFWSRDQRPQESVEEFCADMTRKSP